MQHNADGLVFRRCRKDGQTEGRTTCSRKLGQTDRINNRVSQTDGVSEQRECTREGVRRIKTELAWHKKKSWSMDWVQISRSFTHWFQRSLVRVDSHISCTGLGYKVGPRLCERCKQGQAEVISNSSNKDHQTWEPEPNMG